MQKKSIFKKLILFSFPLQTAAEALNAAAAALPAHVMPEDPDLEDLYTRYKQLQQQLEFLEVQEEYIKVLTEQK